MNNGKKTVQTKHSFSDFLLHIHPRTVPQQTLKYSLSWGLGGMTLTLVSMLLLSGILQLLVYSPNTDTAYADILHMYKNRSFSGLIRNIHYWSGNLLVLTAFFHLLRVFYTGALDKKRRNNWLIGLLLFGIVLFSNFTGYLLPWDQLAYWAVTIFTNMLSYIPFVGGTLVNILRGGDEITQTTLANFFALHVAILPISLLFFSVWHIWIVRKAGGLILDRTVTKNDNLKVKSNPHLIVREIATALMLIGVVTIFSIFVNAPLNDPANPAMSPNPAKGAWYFLGLQELLLHFHPSFAICVIPFVVGSLLVVLPYFEGHILPGGKWFGGGKGIKTFGLTFLSGTLLTSALVIFDDIFLRSNQIGHGNTDLYTRGWIPFLTLTSCSIGLYLILLRLLKVKKPEITMILFTLLSSSLITMTIIGLFFRGTGMQLIFPWNG